MTKLLLGPIIGGLSHESAYLWGRTDGPAILFAWVGSKPDLSDAQLKATSLPLTDETGFAGVAPITDLSPNTCYYYSLTLSDAPPDPRQGEYASFTTFPVPSERQSFSFAFGSCFRPADENGGKIFDKVEQRRQADDLRFILMIGDQIYADAFDNNGIGKVACTLQEYRQVYAYSWSRPPLRRLLENLPVFMTMDDHEVDDDWRWLDRTRQWAYIPWWDQWLRWLQGRPPQERHIPLKRVQDALQAYWEHQGMHAPHLDLAPQINYAGQYALPEDDPGSLAYTFTYGAAAFFVLDTRTRRVTNAKERTILGESQWEALKSWLRAVNDTYPVKFLVTSCALLFQLWTDFPRDRWSGFRKERDQLLQFLAEEEIQGLYLLSGDLHSAHAVEGELNCPSGRAIPLWEFCSSPFEQGPNWTSKYFHYPLRTKFINHKANHFIKDELNFGVVNVDYAEDGEPSVRFKVYGENGNLLAETG
jgi:alkaline phosphatase D